MKKNVLFLILVIVLSACIPTTPVSPTDPSVVSTVCTKPESDNQYSWDVSACVDVSTTVYKLKVQVADEVINHSELNASGGRYYFRLWQDGKGLLPVMVLSIDPPFEGVNPESYIILKTSDLKAMALPSGAITVFICNKDTEVLSPVQYGQVLTTDRQTYELDDCRMLSPNYTEQ